MIKALIYKDCVNLKKMFFEKKGISLFLMIYLILIYIQGSVSASTYLGIISYIAFINTFNFDSEAKSTNYLFGTPARDKYVILAKYLLAFILGISFYLISLGLTFLINFIFQEIFSYSIVEKHKFMENILAIGLSQLGIFTMYLLFIPLLFKFGVKYFLVFVFGFFAAISIITYFLKDKFLYIIEPIKNLDGIVIFAIAAGIWLLALFVSYLICKKILSSRKVS
ncbi:ABC-2 transporter permease [Peptoniphilus catoniae]|uniref:ABC-2 transporter permease n=1 Tax=Peptoniphilus catoniae TaxID=1660341 RepID=UPI0010FE16F5|nr:ABC-2 transporter permease [Peptoniphilus catoniae]